MGRRVFIAAIAILTAMSLSGFAAAAEYTVSGSIAGQLGNYGFTITPDESITLIEGSVSAPLLRYSLAIERDPWTLAGFLSTQNRANGVLELEGETPSDDVTGWGRVTAMGLDGAYMFDLGCFRIGPSVGYRRTTIAAFIESASESSHFSFGYGLTTSGIRVGARASAPLGDKVTLTGSVGYSPWLRYSMFQENVVYISDSDETQHFVMVSVPEHPIVARALDAGIGASVKLTPTIEVICGYNYESSLLKSSQVEAQPFAFATAMSSVFHVGVKGSF
ncbi:MAG: hypothetical protein BWY85_00359 [Firmicutes bacterium ADurb.Bin506]|nr:MAG: hypothetical protein BWY85_00359 [Firmicutes bacterium ADurb.Bin506]